MAHPMSVDQLDLGDHVCWTFDDDGERSGAMARFVAGAFQHGHQVLYATASLTPDPVIADLRACEVDVDGPLGSGQLRVQPADHTHLADAGSDPERAIDRLTREVDQAIAEGYRGVRVVADMAWAHADGAGIDRLMRYEELVNTLFAGGAAVGLCLYDRRLFPVGDLHRVGTAHPGTTWAEDDSAWLPLLHMRRTADPPRLQLVGEVDLSNHHAFAPVLAGMPAGGADRDRPPLVIDASALTFVDASAAGLLIRVARAAPAGLQVRGCTPAVARTLEIIGAHDVPGLAVTSEAG